MMPTTERLRLSKKPRVALPGRDQVRCVCGQSPGVSLEESRREVGRYVFRCLTPGCPERGRRRWWELREGQAPRPIDRVLLRRETSGRNQSRLPIPDRLRRCPTPGCGAWRPASKYRLVGYRRVYRLRCRVCRRSQHFGEDFRQIRLGQRLKYPEADRPRCPHCRALKVVSHPITVASVGPVMRFICSRTRRTKACPSTPEYRTQQGRPVSLEEIRRLRTETNFKVKVPIPNFDRGTRARCPKCTQPMRYEGIKRTGTACRFVCDRDHEKLARYFSVTTGEELPQTARLRKTFPWGGRPVCGECQSVLLSVGEFTTEGSDDVLYRFRCPTASCSIREVYLDASGKTVRVSRPVFRRTSRLTIPTRGTKRLCRLCRRGAVSNPKDRRQRYCTPCRGRYTAAQRWERAQVAQHGEGVFRVRRLLKTGADVKRLREGQGLFQVALAQRAGLSVELVKKIEQEAIPISKKSRERLATALLHA